MLENNDLLLDSSLVDQYIFAEKNARYVSVGDHNFNTYRDGSRYKLIRRYNLKNVLHPKYDKFDDPPIFDIAIIQMFIPIMFKFYRHARPLCLPNPFDYKEKSDGLVAAWGTTEYGGKITNIK